MTHQANNLKRAQLTDSLRDYAAAANSRPPGGGWVRAIRGALGMTQAQLASRLAISRQSIQELEQAESERRITLDSLDRLAAGLGCRVVYAVVPVQEQQSQVVNTLDDMRSRRARKQAEQMLGPVTHSMAMESQGVPSNVRERQLAMLMDELLRGSARNLWK